MEVVGEKLTETSEDFKEKVIEEIRKNYDFALFCILPGIDGRMTVIERSAKKIGIEPDQIESFKNSLLKSGLWKMDGDSVVSNFELLDLGDLSISDYLSMTVCIISELSESKSYEYDSLALVTSRDLVRDFVRQVNGSLKELYKRSMSPDCAKNVIFSWTHTGVIEFESKQKKVKSEEEQ